MNYFSSNLKFLRTQKKFTQTQFANKIGISRAIIGSYEEGRAEPKLVTLQNIAHFFKVSMDDLLEIDLSHTITQVDYEGNKLRILPIIVDQNQKEKITVVPIKAAAGYLNGYADAEYIESLNSFDFPISELGNQNTFRLFQIKGDSMLPIPPNSYIIGEYLENWKHLKDGKCYVVISKDDGIVYKRVVSKIEEDEALELISDNKNYDPYTIPANEIIELWKAKAYISFDLPDQDFNNSISVNQLSNMVLDMKKEMEKLKNN